MKLLSIAKYAKQENITDQGARKRVSSKLVKSVQLDENIYIVVDDKCPGIIKDLKHKIRLLQSNIKSLKLEAITVMKQEDYINRLETRVETLETKLDESTAKKEELYEKVINTVMISQKKHEE